MQNIYAGDVGVTIELDTHQNLIYVTLMAINVTKPDGTTTTWTATRKGTTQSITYTTVAGDLSIPGVYILRSYCEWSSESSHTGDPIELVVESTGDLTGLLTTFRVLYRYIKPADVPYNAFSIYYGMAVDEHTQNLVTYGNPTLTTSQTDAALCHLIADYFEKGNPDWTYSSQSISPGVSFSRSQKNGNVVTPARAAYQELLNDIVAARTRYARPFFHYSQMTFKRNRMEIEPDPEGDLDHISK